LYGILKLFCTPQEQQQWSDRFRAGGLGYGEVKKAILERFMDRFGSARCRRQELENEPEYVEMALRKGAEEARAVGLPLVRQVRDAVGIANRAS
jgi:tryptophanyl-tRNA synthetase